MSDDKDASYGSYEEEIKELEDSNVLLSNTIGVLTEENELLKEDNSFLRKSLKQLQDAQPNMTDMIALKKEIQSLKAQILSPLDKEYQQSLISDYDDLDTLYIEKHRECEKLRNKLLEIKKRIIDNPVYSSQMAQVIFNDIVNKVLKTNK